MPGAPYRHAPCPGCDPIFGQDNLVGPATAHDPDAVSVVVLGDSMSVGYGLSHELGWPHLLGRMLEAEIAPRPVQIHNLAVGGYELGEAAASYRLWGRAYRPDLVIHAMFVNDLTQLRLLSHYHQENVLVSFLPFQGGIGPTGWLPESLRIGLFRRSYLYQLMTPRAHGLYLALGSRGDLLAATLTEAEASATIDDLTRDIREDGATPFAALLPPSTWPRCLGAAEEPDCEGFEWTLDRQATYASAAGVPYVDFRERMRGAPGLDYTNQALFPHDMDHYGETGHRELAAHLRDALLAHGIVDELRWKEP
jgi:lysophospholipase L1-like esterase